MSVEYSPSFSRSGSVLAKRIFFGSLAILAVVLMGALIASSHLYKLERNRAERAEVEASIRELSPSIGRAIWQFNDESMHVFLDTLASRDVIRAAEYADEFMSLNAGSLEGSDFTSANCDEILEYDFTGFKFQDVVIENGVLRLCFQYSGHSTASNVFVSTRDLPFLIAIFATSLIFVVFSWKLVILPLRNLSHHIADQKPIEDFQRNQFFGLGGEQDEIDKLIGELINRTNDLKNERALVEASFPEIEDAIIQTDANFVVVRYNKSFENIMQSSEDLTNLDLKSKFPISILSALGKTNEFTTNDERILELTTTTVDSHGDATSFLIVIRDLTEKKKLEKEALHASKLAALGTMSSGIAHDYNNLLATVLSNAELLNTTAKLNEVGGKALNSIIDASLRGSSLSNQLLDFAQNRKPKTQNIDSEKIVDSIREMAYSVIHDGIKFESMPNAAPSEIQVDSGNLKNAILNLIINARDAIGASGKITLETQLATRSKKDYFEFSIIDNGKGISAANLEKIRDPFFTTKPQGKGAGLGLAMVSSFADQNNGYFDIESKVGVGTKMTIGVPRVGASPESFQVQPSIVDSSSGKARILLVEDEVSLCQVLAIFLESEGYDVKFASTYQEVSELGYANQFWDLVVCDVMLHAHSVVDIYTLFERAQNNVPFIVITGNMPEELKSKIHSINPIKVIEKPFRSNDFLTSVSEALIAIKAAE